MKPLMWPDPVVGGTKPSPIESSYSRRKWNLPHIPSAVSWGSSRSVQPVAATVCAMPYWAILTMELSPLEPGDGLRVHVCTNTN